MEKSSNCLRLLRGHLHFEGDTAYFAELPGRGNGDLMSFVGCDLIGMIPSGSGPMKRGDRINALRLPRFLC